MNIFFFPSQERRSTVPNVTWNTRSSHLYSDPSLASHSTAICEGSPSSSSVLRDAVVILLYANVPFSPAQPFIYSLFIYFSFILKIPSSTWRWWQREREREGKPGHGHHLCGSWSYTGDVASWLHPPRRETRPLLASRQNSKWAAATFSEIRLKLRFIFSTLHFAPAISSALNLLVMSQVIHALNTAGPCTHATVQECTHSV